MPPYRIFIMNKHIITTIALFVISGITAAGQNPTEPPISLDEVLASVSSLKDILPYIPQQTYHSNFDPKALRKEDIEPLKAKAQQGDVEAEGQLAAYYTFVEPNLEESLAWSKKAAEHGHVYGFLSLGYTISCPMVDLMWIFQKLLSFGKKPLIEAIRMH